MFVPHVQDGSRKLGELLGSSSQEKTEVWSHTAEDGAPLLELVEYSWGSGIGWYVQKRIRLDSVQVDALKSLLGTGLVSGEATRPRTRVSSLTVEENVIQLQFGE